MVRELVSAEQYEARRLVPQASGTIPIFGPAGSRGAIAVLADDRVTRQMICDRVRIRDFIPLPLSFPLDAVITFERVSPKIAIIVTPALGLPARAVIDFLAHDHPEVMCIVVDATPEPQLATRVAAQPRNLDELEQVLDRLAAPPAPPRRALVVVAHASWRRAVCDCLAELGWDAVGAADLATAEHAMSGPRFDIAVFDSGSPHCHDEILQLRSISPGLAVIVLASPSAPPVELSGTLMIQPNIDRLAEALTAAQWES